MPQQKTQTKKTSTKKRPNKLGKALNWLKPTTPAKGMLLFVVVFAIAGGAYYAYKSSAATIYVTNYPPNDVVCLSSCAQIRDDHAKSPTNAAKLYSNNGSASSLFYLGSPWNLYPSTTGIPTRVCAKLRSNNNTSGTQAYIWMGWNQSITDPSAPISQWNWGTFEVASSLTYTKYCTGYMNIPGGAHYGHVQVRQGNSVDTSSRNDMYVSSVTVEGR